MCVSVCLCVCLCVHVHLHLGLWGEAGYRAPSDGRGGCARGPRPRLDLGACQARVRQAAGMTGCPALYTKPTKAETKSQKNSSAVSQIET